MGALVVGVIAFIGFVVNTGVTIHGNAERDDQTKELEKIGDKKEPFHKFRILLYIRPHHQ